jgi:hypothetical protein
MFALVAVDEKRVIPRIEDLSERLGNEVRIIFNKRLLCRLHFYMTYPDSVFFTPSDVFGRVFLVRQVSSLVRVVLNGDTLWF